MMDLFTAMHTFALVVDKGSFVAAARELDVTPAVVTKSIAELERRLGARLINRTTRRLALTEIGEDYLEQARVILSKVDDANSIVQSVTGEPSGTLRVGGTTALLTHQVIRLLPEFIRRNPKVGFKITPLSPNSADEMNENVDVTLIISPGELQSGDFVAYRLAATEVVFCAAPDYLKEHGEPNHPAELVDHEILVPTTHLTPRFVSFRRRSVAGGSEPEEVVVKSRRDRALICAHHETLHGAALAGMGIVATLSCIAEESILEGKLVQVLREWESLKFTLYAAIPSRKLVPPRTRAFIDFLVEKLGGKDEDPWLERVRVNRKQLTARPLPLGTRANIAS